jgi:hypothetical protein
MTKEDIIRMAREVSGDDWSIFRGFMPELERFAALVAAAEREECAKVCAARDAFYCAFAIRERGAP